MTHAAHYSELTVGDPAPWFCLPLLDGTTFNMDRAAGRYVLLCFMGSLTHEVSEPALRFLAAHQPLFDEERLVAFAVTVDIADRAAAGRGLAGLRIFLDAERAVSRTYGAAPRSEAAGAYRPFWMLLDRTLRIMAIEPFQTGGAELPRLHDRLSSLPDPDLYAGIPVPAPILVVPNVFEPDLCRLLIARYEAVGGVDSGVMQEQGGRTVAVIDHHHKRRADVLLDDPKDKDAVRRRIQRRVVPEIRKVHQFEATYLERYLIGCYASETDGHFRPHRDNTTLGTTHRRFAVSINLNDDFAGGEVVFPEYGARGFRAPAGTAIVFSCSLLHEVRRVERGRRYAFLPFLYDESAAEIRRRNLPYVDLPSSLPAS